MIAHDKACHAQQITNSNVFAEEDILGTRASFRADVDSRHNFRSPAEIALFSNRQKCQDDFFALYDKFNKHRAQLAGALESAFQPVIAVC